MSQVKKDILEKNKIRFTITVSQEEMKPALEDAAQRIATEAKIPGFRPGKASFDAVKRQVGEMKVYEEALEQIVRKAFVEAVMDLKIDTVGSPKIDVEKLAPGNDLVFTAEVDRMPEVKMLTDYKAIKIKTKKKEISDKDVENALKDLMRMQTKEKRADKTHVVTKEDKVIVDLQMKKDGVGVEGGQGTNHAIYLNETYYIPGLAEKLVGAKEGEEKKFQLTFPEENHQKHLAGQKIDFEVNIKEVYELEHPELDDAFAESLGQKDMAGLKKILKENMQQEKDQEETYRQEKAMLEELAKKSQFEEIPDLLVNEEVNKMMRELESSITNQGGKMEDYLTQIKKTHADLKLDLTAQAITRIQVAIVIRKVAEEQKITVDEKDLDKELDHLAEQYKDEESKKKVYSPDYRDYAKSMMRNRKVIDYLRSVMID